jgi:hypothetical protein
MAPTALGGPPRALGDFQEALLESVEPTKPTGAIPILMKAKGDRPVTKVHPCHDYALLSIGSVIRPCYFILLPFCEQHEAGIE